MMPRELKFRRFCEVIAETQERLCVPGVAVGLWYEGQEYVQGLGITSIEHSLPVTPDTLFQVGSITKTFVATAVMRLVDQHKIGLDIPIRAYLPDLQLADDETAHAVTMRHLLTHTGGWLGDYFNDFGDSENALARMVQQLAGLPQLTPLGKIWSYNNAGFYLAGRLIEVVTELPFEAAIKQLVFDPLDLEMTCFFLADVITHRFGVGHLVDVRQDTITVARPWPVPRASAPAGGVISTVKDLLKYARFHMGDGRSPDGECVLRRESLAEMQSPQVNIRGGFDMGLTWFIEPINGAACIRHGGATNGQMAELKIIPSRDFALVLLTNSNRGGDLIAEMAAYAVQEFLGLEACVPEPIQLNEDRLTPYLGCYDSALGIMELTLQNGQLIGQLFPKGGFPTPDSPPPPVPPPIRLVFYQDDAVFVPEGSAKGSFGEFLRNPDGSIAWFRFGGRVRARVED